MKSQNQKQEQTSVAVSGYTIFARNENFQFEGVVKSRDFNSIERRRPDTITRAMREAEPVYRKYVITEIKLQKRSMDGLHRLYFYCSRVPKRMVKNHPLGDVRV